MFSHCQVNNLVHVAQNSCSSTIKTMELHQNGIVEGEGKKKKRRRSGEGEEEGEEEHSSFQPMTGKLVVKYSYFLISLEG